METFLSGINPVPGLGLVVPVDVFLERKDKRGVAFRDPVLCQELDAVVCVFQEGQVAEDRDAVLQVGHSC